MTGQNVTMGNRPQKTIRTLKMSRSQPELPSVQEIVNVQIKKGSPFGITEYTVPKIGTNLNIKRSALMAAKCGDGAIDQFKKLHAYKPSPGLYDVSYKWNKTILGNMKGGKRNTFIEKIFQDEKAKPRPGPGAYSPKKGLVTKRNSLGVINNGDRIPFTSDSEYLGTMTPAATYTEGVKLPKTFRYDVKKKGWRIEKKDGPDPQSYPFKEEAIKKMTKKVSPQWKQGKGKRKFFTDEAQKRSQNSPGSGMYSTIDYNKIHRRLTSKRH
eukprot:CAMPEP_0205822624 /NCGR_PEP_ID=MMETSP0206-20130828/13308_1 /ASSEMBLY_ACC=CAM_ASM_000279 /TAXON_ID=36767 /ORGANISM="Euplotes focardii, Strain TN1" /LENGTH=267 /DNA_ID=CAMNT_0053119053 /DNA_START=69 /DNA_END=872 /DNA_ORIENTATION=+